MKQLFILINLSFFIFSANAATSKAPAKDALSRDELMKELLGESQGKDETALYSDIVAFYQANEQRKLRHRLQSLLSQFPNSPYADNALYLAGRQALENRNYPEAIRYFQRVISQYPQSNRAVSSVFAKAMAYKKMNLKNQAKKVFTELKTRFPGSPESFRADSELKLIK